MHLADKKPARITKADKDFAKELGLKDKEIFGKIFAYPKPGQK